MNNKTDWKRYLQQDVLILFLIFLIYYVITVHKWLLLLFKVTQTLISLQHNASVCLTINITHCIEIENLLKLIRFGWTIHEYCTSVHPSYYNIFVMLLNVIGNYWFTYFLIIYSLTMYLLQIQYNIYRKKNSVCLLACSISLYHTVLCGHSNLYTMFQP